MTTPLAMFSFSKDDSAHPFGFYEYVAEKGWEHAYSTNVFGASDAPSVDEVIGGGFGLCLAWGTGRFRYDYTNSRPIDIAHVAGYEHRTGRTITCHPRGPGAFARFDEFFPGGLKGWVDATRKRTDRCRAAGLPTMIFLGLPSANSLSGPYGVVSKTLERWTQPIIDAGIETVALDSSGAVSTFAPNAALTWAEYMLEQGLNVAVETIEVATPSAFPWFNGRFGVVAMPEARTARDGAGWFNHHCPGVNTTRYLWLQGSIHPQDRVSLFEDERAKPDGDTVIVETAGCWEGLKEVMGKPPTGPSFQLAELGPSAGLPPTDL